MIGEKAFTGTGRPERAFGEEKGKQLLSRLAQNTIDLVQITEKTVVPVVSALEEKYDSKNKYE